jgi:hypothetical protein
MEYTKPVLNQIGAAEGLVLGGSNFPGDISGTTTVPPAFEFEE